MKEGAALLFDVANEKRCWFAKRHSLEWACLAHRQALDSQFFGTCGDFLIPHFEISCAFVSTLGVFAASWRGSSPSFCVHVTLRERFDQPRGRAHGVERTPCSHTDFRTFRAL